MYENFDAKRLFTICILPTNERFLIVQDLMAFSIESIFDSQLTNISSKIIDGLSTTPNIFTLFCGYRFQ